MPIGLRLSSAVLLSKSRKRPFGSSELTRSDHGQRGHAAVSDSGVFLSGLVHGTKLPFGSCVLLRRYASSMLSPPPYEMPVAASALGSAIPWSTSEPSRNWVSCASRRRSFRWIQPVADWSPPLFSCWRQSGVRVDGGWPHDAPKPRAE